MKKRISIIAIMFIMVLAAVGGLIGCVEEAKQLSTPSNVVASTTTRKLTWTAVDNASGYQVRVNEEGTPIDVTEPEHSLEELTEPATYKLYVRAIGKDKYKNSDWSTGTDYIVSPPVQLAKPSTPTFNENAKKVIWNAVDNATGYRVDVDGEVSTVTAAEFEVEELFEENGTYEIKVQAFGGFGYTDSAWSEVYSLVVARFWASFEAVGLGTGMSIDMEAIEINKTTNTITLPAAEVVEGYRFLGYKYINEALRPVGAVVTADAADVGKDIIIKVVYEKIFYGKFTVVDASGDPITGLEIDDVEISTTGVLTFPTPPDFADYAFVKYAIDGKDDITELPCELNVGNTANVEIEAVYRAAKFVTFDVQGLRPGDTFSIPRIEIVDGKADLATVDTGAAGSGYNFIKFMNGAVEVTDLELTGLENSIVITVVYETVGYEATFVVSGLPSGHSVTITKVNSDASGHINMPEVADVTIGDDKYVLVGFSYDAMYLSSLEFIDIAGLSDDIVITAIFELENISDVTADAINTYLGEKFEDPIVPTKRSFDDIRFRDNETLTIDESVRKPVSTVVLGFAEVPVNADIRVFETVEFYVFENQADAAWAYANYDGFVGGVHAYTVGNVNTARYGNIIVSWEFADVSAHGEARVIELLVDAGIIDMPSNQTYEFYMYNLIKADFVALRIPTRSTTRSDAGYNAGITGFNPYIYFGTTDTAVGLPIPTTKVGENTYYTDTTYNWGGVIVIAADEQSAADYFVDNHYVNKKLYSNIVVAMSAAVATDGRHEAAKEALGIEHAGGLDTTRVDAVTSLAIDTVNKKITWLEVSTAENVTMTSDVRYMMQIEGEEARDITSIVEISAEGVVTYNFTSDLSTTSDEFYDFAIWVEAEDETIYRKSAVQYVQYRIGNALPRSIDSFRRFLPTLPVFNVGVTNNVSGFNAKSIRLNPATGSSVPTFDVYYLTDASQLDALLASVNKYLNRHERVVENHEGYIIFVFGVSSDTIPQRMAALQAFGLDDLAAAVMGEYDEIALQNAETLSNSLVDTEMFETGEIARATAQQGANPLLNGQYAHQFEVTSQYHGIEAGDIKIYAFGKTGFINDVAAETGYEKAVYGSFYVIMYKDTAACNELLFHLAIKDRFDPSINSSIALDSSSNISEDLTVEITDFARYTITIFDLSRPQDAITKNAYTKLVNVSLDKKAILKISGLPEGAFIYTFMAEYSVTPKLTFYNLFSPVAQDGTVVYFVDANTSYRFGIVMDDQPDFATPQNITFSLEFINVSYQLVDDAGAVFSTEGDGTAIDLATTTLKPVVLTNPDTFTLASQPPIFAGYRFSHFEYIVGEVDEFDKGETIYSFCEFGENPVIKAVYNKVTDIMAELTSFGLPSSYNFNADAVLATVNAGTTVVVFDVLDNITVGSAMFGNCGYRYGEVLAVYNETTEKYTLTLNSAMTKDFVVEALFEELFTAKFIQYGLGGAADTVAMYFDVPPIAIPDSGIITMPDMEASYTYSPYNTGTFNTYYFIGNIYELNGSTVIQNVIYKPGQQYTLSPGRNYEFRCQYALRPTAASGARLHMQYVLATKGYDMLQFSSSLSIQWGESSVNVTSDFVFTGGLLGDAIAHYILVRDGSIYLPSGTIIVNGNDEAAKLEAYLQKRDDLTYIRNQKADDPTSAGLGFIIVMEANAKAKLESVVDDLKASFTSGETTVNIAPFLPFGEAKLSVGADNYNFTVNEVRAALRARFGDVGIAESDKTGYVEIKFGASASDYHGVVVVVTDESKLSDATTYINSTFANFKVQGNVSNVLMRFKDPIVKNRVHLILGIKENLAYTALVTDSQTTISNNSQALFGVRLNAVLATITSLEYDDYRTLTLTTTGQNAKIYGEVSFFTSDEKAEDFAAVRDASVDFPNDIVVVCGNIVFSIRLAGLTNAATIPEFIDALVDLLGLTKNPPVDYNRTYEGAAVLALIQESYPTATGENLRASETSPINAYYIEIKDGGTLVGGAIISSYQAEVEKAILEFGTTFAHTARHDNLLLLATTKQMLLDLEIDMGLRFASTHDHATIKTDLETAYTAVNVTGADLSTSHDIDAYMISVLIDGGTTKVAAAIVADLQVDMENAIALLSGLTFTQQYDNLFLAAKTAQELLYLEISLGLRQPADELDRIDPLIVEYRTALIDAGYEVDTGITNNKNDIPRLRVSNGAWAATIIFVSRGQTIEGNSNLKNFLAAENTTYVPLPIHEYRHNIFFNFASVADYNDIMFVLGLAEKVTYPTYNTEQVFTALNEIKNSNNAKALAVVQKTSVYDTTLNAIEPGIGVIELGRKSSVKGIAIVASTATVAKQAYDAIKNLNNYTYFYQISNVLIATDNFETFRVLQIAKCAVSTIKTQSEIFISLLEDAELYDDVKMFDLEIPTTEVIVAGFIVPSQHGGVAPMTTAYVIICEDYSLVAADLNTILEVSGATDVLVIDNIVIACTDPAIIETMQAVYPSLELVTSAQVATALGLTIPD